VLFSLLVYVAVYAVFVSFGLYYIYGLLRDGPAGESRDIPWRHGQAVAGIRRHG
jgi:cytochrome bd-type quinol oxidase subunit 1